MFDEILLPTDGSDNAAKAIDHAILLADTFDATVHGVYVMNLTYAADFDGGIDGGAVFSALEREGKTALETVRSRCESDGIDVQTELLEGRPAHSITTYASEHDVDLVTMGTHGRSGVSRLLLGSITESVVRSTDRPVLTIPTDAPDPGDAYEAVLVATDGSDDARHAAETAAGVAAAFDARLHGVYVVDLGGTRNQMIDSILEEEGDRAVNAVSDIAENRGVESTTAVLKGVPHETIAEYASEHDVDLVAVGSHGKGAIERTFLGSVSERTIRSASQPVLVTRRPLDAE
ncbi:MAG: universal stress protein [Halanaeroarchaeum sp.]